MNLSPTLSLPNALACIQASASCYSRPATFETPLAHVLDLDLPDARILAFRGSASAQDWLTDAQFIRTNAGDGISIHRGFYSAIASIAPELLRRLNFSRKPIFITGHSLGGALAVLAAKLLDSALRDTSVPSDRSSRLISVYTFGGPRVGNAAFANSYNTRLGPRTFRFVHEEDVVARLPFWCTGYRHVGQEIFLPSTGGYRLDPPLWSVCLSDVIGLYHAGICRGPLALAEVVRDHPSAQYLTRLQSICGASPVPVAA